MASQGRVLVVAGSDPTAGAGLQMDIKAIHALGGYAMTAVTALTVQDTARVYAVHPVAAELVGQQMRACLEDIGADCVKLGMLANRAIVAEVAAVLADYPALPVVADPVLRGSGGGVLLDEAGVELYRERLLPRATLITPNLPEAAVLSGIAITTREQAVVAARQLAVRGGAVLLKGGHGAGEVVSDFLVISDRVREYRWRRQAGEGGYHGTGCALAAASAAGVARGMELEAAVTAAEHKLQQAIAASWGGGGGQRILRV